VGSKVLLQLAVHEHVPAAQPAQEDALGGEVEEADQVPASS
jgi:hypothetical protein